VLHGVQLQTLSVAQIYRMMGWIVNNELERILEGTGRVLLSNVVDGVNSRSYLEDLWFASRLEILFPSHFYGYLYSPVG
jgi:hypothetical protein